MKNTTAIKITLIVTSIFTLTSCGTLRKPSDVRVSGNYPDRNQNSIIKSWGVPSEILIQPHTLKLGDNVVTWVYYLEDKSGDVAPVFYSFRHGNALATNGFGNAERRVMNINDPSDMSKILSKREQIKKIWPVWEE